MKDTATTAGLFEAVMGGARPRVGTPPFAPPMTQQTGGANMPTTPETMPVKHGIAGFFDRVFNPTNALGQFGQALIASGSGPLAGAMAHMIQQRALVGQRDQQFEQFKRQYDYELEHPKERAPVDDVFTRTLTAAGIDPTSEQGRTLYRQRAATLASPAPQMVGSAEDGYQFVTPPSPTLPGALGAPIASQVDAPVVEDGYRYTPGPGGKANKANWAPVAAGGVGSNAGGNFLGL